jgi:hypothetical protein
VPPGLDLSSGGIITGVPSVVGTYTFALQVFDSGSPVKFDSKWYTATIKANDGGSSGSPAITSIRVKGVKKLWITGVNFHSSSLISINGNIFEPADFSQDGSVTQLLARGKLNLGPSGSNVVVVMNNENRSGPFVF